MIHDFLFSTLATAGFAVLLNSQKKMVPLASLLGGVVWCTYRLLEMSFDAKIMNYFFAAVAAALLSEATARLAKKPVTTFVICAVIPLVPGAGMYYTMIETLQGSPAKALALGMETLLIAGAIATGIALVASLVMMATRAIERLSDFHIHWDKHETDDDAEASHEEYVPAILTKAEEGTER